MLNIDKSKALCVSGHRVIGNDLDVDKLTEVFNQAVESGYRYFLIGMAIGFDTLCFKILQRIKNARTEKDIKLIACVPCKEQDAKFTEKQKEEYSLMLANADHIEYVSLSYNKWCMQKRNRFLVDNSSVIVSYLRKNTGGTFYTINYAKTAGIKIILM